AKGRIAHARRHDRREEHHVSFVALEPVNRVSQEIEVRQAGNQAVTAGHDVPYSIRLCSKRTDHPHAPAVPLSDQPPDLAHNLLSLGLVHRSASGWANGLTTD